MLFSQTRRKEIHAEWTVVRKLDKPSASQATRTENKFTFRILMRLSCFYGFIEPIIPEKKVNHNT